MNSKAKGVVALILAVAVLANVGIFAKMSYNKTHTAQAVSYTHLDVYKRQPQAD